MALGSIAQAGKAAPSTAMNTSNIAFDNSGFVVNVGSGTASSSKAALPSAAQAVQGVAAGVGSLLGNPLVIVAVGLGLFLYLKHK